MTVPPDDPGRGNSGEGSHSSLTALSSSPSSQSTFEEWSSTGDSPPASVDDASPSSSSEAQDDAAGDTDAGDARGGVVPRSGSSTVYVDLSTGIYHACEEHTGPDPAAFTRDQAEHFSYRACPDCF